MDANSAALHLHRLFASLFACSREANYQLNIREVAKMKFLCLAYGDEEGWNSLTETERQEVLAQDEVIRDRGNLMSAVKSMKVTSVRNWGNNLEVINEPYAQNMLPLAGFSVIEAENVKEVIGLVSNTPCARAKGVIEIYPFWDLAANDA
jgi:hypothetical protein